MNQNQNEMESQDVMEPKNAMETQNEMIPQNEMEPQIQMEPSKVKKTQKRIENPEFLAQIQELLTKSFPRCEVCDTSPQLISDMLSFVMKDIIKRTHRRKKRRKKRIITAKHIRDVLENTPEYHFLLDLIPK